MSGIMMAERLWRERKERIHEEKIAAVLSPLALRVATGFIIEHDTELGGQIGFRVVRNDKSVWC